MDPSQHGTYSYLFSILSGQPGFVASTILYSLLTGLGLLVIGAWLPWLALCWTGDDSAGDDSRSDSGSDGESVASESAATDAQTPPTLPLTGLTLMTLGVGGGLCSVVILGTLSAFLFKHLVPGVILAGLLGLLATMRLVSTLRHRQVALRLGGWVFAAVTGVSFLIGLWQHVFAEIPKEFGNTKSYVFSELHGDSGFHVFLSSILMQTGLPLRDLYGSPYNEYSPVTHTGHGVLIGSVSSVLRVTPYRASSAVWIVSTVLLVWTALDLLSRSAVPKGFLVVGSLCPLFLGPLSTPVLGLLSDPQLALDQAPLVSARMYWNLPQAVSTSLGGVVLLCMHFYGCARQGSRRRLHLIVLSTLVLIASGWVKPSLIIFYGPALLLSLLVHRVGLRDVAVVIGLLAAGVAIYVLPAWLVTVPEVPSWTLHPSVEQTEEVLTFIVLGCGAALLFSLRPLRELFADVARTSQPKPTTLPLIAMGGSLLFALLFREEQFVGFMVFQPNLWWGPSACVVLLFPSVLARAIRQIKQAGKPNGLILTGLLIVTIQLANGGLFAIAYPGVGTRSYVAHYVEALRVAGARTPPTTSFLLDPGVAQIRALSELGRPTLVWTTFMAPKDFEIFREWTKLFVPPYETDDSGWSQYDAAFLHRSSTHAQEKLEELGWSREELSDDFQLWRR